MNKLDLIATLKNETRLTKSEATAVVDLFFDEINAALTKGERVEIRGCVPSMSRNTRRMPGGILKPGNRPK